LLQAQREAAGDREANGARGWARAARSPQQRGCVALRSIYSATRLLDPLAQRELVGRAAQFAKSWANFPAARQCALLTALIERIDATKSDQHVRGEIAEADKPREIGWADAFLLGHCGKRHTVAAGECGIELARPDQQLDQPHVGLRCGKRIGPVEQRRSFNGTQDLGFGVAFGNRAAASREPFSTGASRPI
jgi:hypothetical protein